MFTTTWKRTLRGLIDQLTEARRHDIGTGDMSSTVLLGSIDRLLKQDFGLQPEFLNMCSAGWDRTDYGELHAGGTSGNRK